MVSLGVVAEERVFRGRHISWVAYMNDVLDGGLTTNMMHTLLHVARKSTGLVIHRGNLITAH